METRQPIALLHNNEFLFVEENTNLLEEDSRNFSSFKVFNLKEPVDSIILSALIVPQSIKQYYSIEVSEYNGSSAKVKIHFSNKTHSDVINLLREATTNLYYISENGLMDWVPTDSITLNIIYPNACSTSNQSGDDDIVEDTGILDLGDVEWLTRKLHEMALLFQSKNDIPSDVLEGLFHSIFPRRVTSLNVIEGVGILISAMDQRLRYNIIRTVFRKLAELINDNNLRSVVLENKFSPDLGLHLILSLWTLIEGFRDIYKSFNNLKNSDEQFKRIISAEKSYFITYVDHICLIIENILTIIDREQYDLISARLDILVKAIEDLMKLTEIISVKCNEYLKEIETEEKGAKVRALVHLGVAAFEVYYGVSKYKTHNTVQRVCEAALFVTNGFAFGFALAAKQELSKAIEQQNNTLKRLHEFHLMLTKMTQKGRIVLDLSGNEMLDQRNTIIEEFAEFQIQCKSFKDVLDDLEE
ncbi:128_t:CDS:2 [Cetraspora pellucida]|uniref:128_t:CDS:1 n=1 Tax=Cetraspora pellucida TaxID=1433469 RepID=A0A9N8VYN4_9GLOM|nr:128_t:CDS:2 [Cetraspora pellucida]